jgi:imidazoleglycerol phosphate synthase glutamine amidotransferase subunit HisH
MCNCREVERRQAITGCESCKLEQAGATQFHPEKSGEAGLRMYANFLGM